MTQEQKALDARKRTVVVGGSAAGPMAAARARRLDEQAESTVRQQADELSMASVMEGGIAAWPYPREK